MPLAIVAVVVSYVVSIRLSPAPAEESAAKPAPESAGATPPASGSA
jgi:hypothetical protein